MRVKASFEQLDALVAIGGEDTLGVAARLYEELGVNVVGVPKTIDNDLAGTDYTFGFDTAVAICTEAIDRLHTTAESHNRVMVVEVMGRHTGWIAVHSGIAGGADVILIPERPVDIDEVCAELRAGMRRKNFSIVVVSEGCELAGRRGQGRGRPVRPRLLAKRGVGEQLGAEIESADRLRDARDGARPRAARRLADRLRPHPRDALRAQGGRPRRGRRVRPDGGAARRRRRRRLAARGDGGAEDRARRAGTTSRGRSSARPQQLAEREAAVPPRRHEEVLPVRRREHRVEALAAVARLERRSCRPAGRRPSRAGCGGSRRRSG